MIIKRSNTQGFLSFILNVQWIFFFKQAIRNKEIDMKTGAEILGVSYGTLYGRYRETIGYLKHAWNNAGRTSKPSSYSYR